MKTVAELIEARRDDELDYIKAYIRQHGGDGLYCPTEPCGCGMDDLCPCGEDFLDMDCFPAKGEPGELGGEKCTVYYTVEEDTDA